MNAEIRKLSRNDWQIFKEIRLQMLKEEPQAYARTFEEMVKRTDDEWKENVISANSGLLVLWVNGKLAGINGYFYPNKEEVEIWGMFIRSEFRGHGLGKKLMEEIEKEIRKDKNIKLIRIEVTTTQKVAYGLYKKMGFKVVGRKKGATKFNGEIYDDIILEKIIPKSLS